MNLFLYSAIGVASILLVVIIFTHLENYRALKRIIALDQRIEKRRLFQIKQKKHKIFVANPRRQDINSLPPEILPGPRREGLINEWSEKSKISRAPSF